jgi:hypothetical protein
MTGAASASLRLSEFDNFLFAQIGDETNGMPLTVLSALARRDVDPWEEAAALARMPREAAADRMAILISALPEGASGRRDPSAIAARLVRLLPRENNREDASRATLAGRGATAKLRVVVFVVLMAFLLSAQFFMRRHHPLAQAESQRGSVSSGNSAPRAGR